MQSVQSACVAVPREGQTGRGPPRYFAQPQQFGGGPQSPGAFGGGRASLPRGSREGPGSPASKISKGLWAVDLESHLLGLSLGNEVPHDRSWCSNTLGFFLAFFGPKVSKVAFIWLPNQVMANALKTPKCIKVHRCLFDVLLEADCFDGERVNNVSDRNQNEIFWDADCRQEIQTQCSPRTSESL